MKEKTYFKNISKVYDERLTKDYRNIYWETRSIFSPECINFKQCLERQANDK